MGNRFYKQRKHIIGASAWLMLMLLCVATSRAAAANADQDAASEPFKLAGELSESSGVAVAFSGNCKRILTADERFCRIWDATTLTPITPQLEHGGVVSAASIDREGTTVLTCGASPDMRNHGVLRGTGAVVWSVSGGKAILRIPSHSEGHPVWYADLSPDGAQVVTCANEDPSICLWDAATGRLLLKLNTGLEVQMVKFNLDGSRVLSFASDTAVARQWDTRTGKPIGEKLPSNADRDRHVVCPVRYSADGKLLVLANSDQVYVYDTERNVEISEVREDRLPGRGIFSSVDISADGRLIAATALEYGSRVWNAQNGEPLTEMIGGIGSTQAALSPDGKYLVSHRTGGFGDVTMSGIHDPSPVSPSLSGLSLLLCVLDVAIGVWFFCIDPLGRHIWPSQPDVRAPALNGPTITESGGSGHQGVSQENGPKSENRHQFITVFGFAT